jgi:hypothetical protein
VSDNGVRPGPPVDWEEAERFRSCSPASRADAIEQLVALRAATEHELLALTLASVLEGDHVDDGLPDARLWVSHRLRVGWRTASRWAAAADALPELPAVRETLSEGRLSWEQLAAAVPFLSPDEDVDLAEDLPRMSVAEIEAEAKARRLRTTEDARDARRRRSLRWRRDRETTDVLYSGRLPLERAEQLNAVLDRMAHGAGPDENGIWLPMEVRRADALCELGDREHDADPGPDGSTVVIHVDQSLIDDDGVDANGHLAGENLERSAVLRRLCDTDIEFSVDGPDGATVGIGRASRAIPRWLRRTILRRDQRCRFPGCNRLIRQVHHIQFWTRGGVTDTWNLVGFCWLHHHVVHDDHWRIEGNPDLDELTFISPYGVIHRSRRPGLRPEVRHRADAARAKQPVPT